jgi:acyl transferase domain-containing protein
MPDDTDTVVYRARLETIIKEAKDAEAQSTVARRRVQAARLLLEESKDTALEQTATAARQCVPSSSSSSSSPAAASQLVPTTSSTYEDTVVAGLHLQATAVLNVRQLVNIVLDSSTNYASWRDLMEQALQRYALIKHVTDDAPSNDLEWIQMDSVVLNWISNSISTDLHQVVWERGCTARHLWLAIKNQFLGNREQRTLHLDVVFRTFVQGDLSINEYCHKFKAMADDLADLDAPVEDRILILNIL